jgi:hypothetical protein
MCSELDGIPQAISYSVSTSGRWESDALVLDNATSLTTEKDSGSVGEGLWCDSGSTCNMGEGLGDSGFSGAGSKYAQTLSFQRERISSVSSDVSIMFLLVLRCKIFAIAMIP